MLTVLQTWDTSAGGTRHTSRTGELPCWVLPSVWVERVKPVHWIHSKRRNSENIFKLAKKYWYCTPSTAIMSQWSCTTPSFHWQLLFCLKFFMLWYDGVSRTELIFEILVSSFRPQRVQNLQQPNFLLINLCKTVWEICGSCLECSEIENQLLNLCNNFPKVICNQSSNRLSSDGNWILVHMFLKNQAYYCKTQ